MSSEKAAEIAARLDRLPPSRTIWTMVILISLGGVFEFYDLFFTGYVAPGMVQSGLFKPESLGFFAALQPLAVAGFGTFVFSTFAGLWVGTLVLGYVADRFGRRLIFTWSLVWYMVRKTQICGGLLTMAIVIAIFSQVSTPWILIGLGVLFTLASNIMSYAYHGYQAELYPTRVRARAIGFVYSWSRISAAFAGLAIGILLHGYGVPGVAVFVGMSMLVAICMILLGPSTKGLALETINH
jgi:MFS family permease